MKKGMTLLELVVAIGIWSILLVGASQLLIHTTQISADLVNRQAAHENARGALDALIVNIQMADAIELRTDPDGMLRHLVTHQLNPIEVRNPFTFSFDRNAPPGAARYRVLQYTVNNELVSNITEVRLTLSDDRDFIYITITADDRITLTSTVDVRYKELTIR